MATKVHHLTHTCFGLECDGIQILVDPILVRDTQDFTLPCYPNWIGFDLGAINFVIISHGHDDHLHPPSLLGLSPDVVIYYLDEDPSSCSCEILPKNFLSGLGFNSLRPYQPGDTLRLGPIEVVAVPAAASVEGEEQCSFLIKTDDIVVLDAVDIRDTDVTRKGLSEWVGKVDIAFLPAGASVQWQGFWNQMDVFEAVEFCRWLNPRYAAACGGTQSQHIPSVAGTEERYPRGVSAWYALLLQDDLAVQTVPLLPPTSIFADRHTITFKHLDLTSQPRTNRTSAALATFFCGYDPKYPTRRRHWPDVTVSDWLRTLQPVRLAVQHATTSLEQLLRRCSPTVNKSVAGILCPCLVRNLVDSGNHKLAAQISAHIPLLVDDRDQVMNLGFEYYGPISEMIVNSDSNSQSKDLWQRCLWLDASLFRLWVLYLDLKKKSTFAETDAEALRSGHLETLRQTFKNRRPRLKQSVLQVGKDDLALLSEQEATDDVVRCLFYSSHLGIHKRCLSDIEAVLIDHCDGRPSLEIATYLAHALGCSPDDVELALWGLLSELASQSIATVEWN